MNRQAIEEYILKQHGAKLSHPYGEHIAVYTINDKMFAILEVSKQSLRLSLRCDKRLANLLKAQYEEIMPGHKLNKDKWISIVLSGQLSKNEVFDLITHAYNLAKKADT